MKKVFISFFMLLLILLSCQVKANPLALNNKYAPHGGCDESVSYTYVDSRLEVENGKITGIVTVWSVRIVHANCEVEYGVAVINEIVRENSYSSTTVTQDPVIVQILGDKLTTAENTLVQKSLAKDYTGFDINL